MKLSLSSALEWVGALIGGLLFLLGALEFDQENNIVDVSDNLERIYSGWMQILDIFIVPFRLIDERLFFFEIDNTFTEYELRIIGLFATFLLLPSIKLSKIIFKTGHGYTSAYALSSLSNSAISIIFLIISAKLFENMHFTFAAIFFAALSLLAAWLAVRGVQSVPQLLARRAELSRELGRPPPQPNASEIRVSRINWVIVYTATPITAFLWFGLLSVPMLWISDGAPIQW